MNTIGKKKLKRKRSPSSDIYSQTSSRSNEVFSAEKNPSHPLRLGKELLCEFFLWAPLCIHSTHPPNCCASLMLVPASFGGFTVGGRGGQWHKYQKYTFIFAIYKMTLPSLLSLQPPLYPNLTLKYNFCSSQMSQCG